MAKMTKAQLLAEAETLRNALEAARLEIASLKEAATKQETAAPPAAKAEATELPTAKPWTETAFAAVVAKLKTMTREAREKYLRACVNRPLAQRREAYVAAKAN